jgi:hypothetical protein
MAYYNEKRKKKKTHQNYTEFNYNIINIIKKFQQNKFNKQIKSITLKKSPIKHTYVFFFEFTSHANKE